MDQARKTRIREKAKALLGDIKAQIKSGKDLSNRAERLLTRSSRIIKDLVDVNDKLGRVDRPVAVKTDFEWKGSSFDKDEDSDLLKAKVSFSETFKNTFEGINDYQIINIDFKNEDKFAEVIVRFSDESIVLAQGTNFSKILWLDATMRISISKYSSEHYQAYIRSNSNSRFNKIYNSGIEQPEIINFVKYVNEKSTSYTKVLSTHIRKNDRPKFDVYFVFDLYDVAELYKLYYQAHVSYQGIEAGSDTFTYSLTEEIQRDVNPLENLYILKVQNTDVEQVGESNVLQGHSYVYNSEFKRWIYVYNAPNNVKVNGLNACFFNCLQYLLNFKKIDINNLRRDFQCPRDQMVSVEKVVEICKYLNQKGYPIRVFDPYLQELVTDEEVKEVTNYIKTVNYYYMIDEHDSANYTIIHRYPKFEYDGVKYTDLVCVKEKPHFYYFKMSVPRTEKYKFEVSKINMSNLYLADNHCYILKKIIKNEQCHKCSCMYTPSEIEKKSHTCYIQRDYFKTPKETITFDLEARVDKSEDNYSAPITAQLDFKESKTSQEYSSTILIGLDCLDQVVETLKKLNYSAVIIAHYGKNYDFPIFHAHLKSKYRHLLIDDSLVCGGGIKSFAIRIGKYNFKFIDMYCHIQMSLAKLCESFKVPEEIAKIKNVMMMLNGEKVEMSSKDMITYRGDPDKPDYLSPQEFLDFMNDPRNSDFKENFIRYSINDVKALRYILNEYVKQYRIITDNNEFNPFDSITAPSMANKLNEIFNQRERGRIVERSIDTEDKFNIKENGNIIIPAREFVLDVDKFKEKVKISKTERPVAKRVNGRLVQPTAVEIYEWEKSQTKREQATYIAAKARKLALEEYLSQEKSKLYYVEKSQYKRMYKTLIEKDTPKTKYYTNKCSEVKMFNGYEFNPKYLLLLKKFLKKDLNFDDIMQDLINTNIINPKKCKVEKEGFNGMTYTVFEKSWLVKLSEMYIKGAISYFKEIGIFDGDYILYDVVSLYPYIMGKDFEYPYGEAEKGFKLDEEGNLDLSYLSLIHCKSAFSACKHISDYPTFKDGKNDWKKFDMVDVYLTNIDIKRILKNGGSVVLGDPEKSCYWTRTHKPFKTYIETMFEFKKAEDDKPKSERNHAMRGCSKNGMNSLFGYQCRSKKSSRIFYSKNMNEFDAENVSYIGIDFETKEFMFSSTEDVMNCPVWYGVFILSHSRNYMQNVFDMVGRENILVSETDSIFIKKEFAHCIEKLMGENLGQLKPEWEHSKGMMVGGCKCYSVLEPVDAEGKSVLEDGDIDKNAFKSLSKDVVRNNRSIYSQLILNGFAIGSSVNFIRHMFKRKRQGIIIKNVRKLIINENIVLHEDKKENYKIRKTLTKIIENGTLPRWHISEILEKDLTSISNYNKIVSFLNDKINPLIKYKADVEQVPFYMIVKKSLLHV